MDGSAAQDLRNEFDSLSAQNKMLMESSSQSADLWSLGQLCVSVVGNLHYTLRLALDYPLVPAFAHLYVFYHIGRDSVEDERFKNFLENFKDVLFWEKDIPRDRKQCLESLQQWVIANKDGVQKRNKRIAERRIKSKLPLLYELGEAGYVNPVTRETLPEAAPSIWCILQQRLEAELSLYRSIPSLARAILGNGKLLRGSAASPTEIVVWMSIAALSGYAAEPFISSVLSGYELAEGAASARRFQVLFHFGANLGPPLGSRDEFESQ